MTDTAPIVEVATDIAETIASPSIPMFIDDIMSVYNLSNEIKAKLAGKHPSMSVIFKALLDL